MLLLVAPASPMAMASRQLPEMRLPAPGTFPPIKLAEEAEISMPPAMSTTGRVAPFGTAPVPLTSVPMKFPCSTFPEASASKYTAILLLPEMRLPAPLSAPPMILLWALVRPIPDPPLASVAVPVRSVPMKLP